MQKTTETKKQELIDALIKEQDRIKSKHQNENTREHAAVILYLKHDAYSQKDLESYEMLQAAVNDFETLYNDYCQ